MDYINKIIGDLFTIISVDPSVGGLGVFSWITILLMTLLFCLELIFYAMKRPRGLSNIILIMGILGTLTNLYIILNNSSQIIPNQLLDAALVGIIGGILAVILGICESLYYPCVDTRRSVERSVKELIRFMKEHTLVNQSNAMFKSQQPSEMPSQSLGNKELQHISQQIYDLTHHIKQEFKVSREKSDEHIDQLVEKMEKISSELGSIKPHESIWGPKIVAKTSANPQTPSSNDSTQ